MTRKFRLFGETLESRVLLVGDVPTFDDGIFALPETSNDLVEFEVRRVDANVSPDDDTMFVGFATDDGEGSLDSLREPESYEIRAVARARNRIVYRGSDLGSFRMKGASFLSFAVVKDADVSSWLRAKTQLQPAPDVGFLFPVEDHEVASVRPLGDQLWELKWGDAYTYELQLISQELNADVLVESFINSETADLPPGVELETGDFVSRNYAVTNPGSVSLVDVEIIDDNGTPEDAADDFAPTPNLVGTGVNLGDFDQDGELDPGEVWLYSAAQNAVAGQHASEVTVSVTADDQTLTARDPAHYLATSSDVIDLVLEQLTATPAPFELEGETVYTAGQTYEFAAGVGNDGNVTAPGPIEVAATYRDNSVNVAVVDDLEPDESVSIGGIPVTETEAGAFTLTVQVDPDDDIEEADESDASNTLSETITFVLPDISVVDFVASPSPLDPTEIGEDPVYDLGQTYALRPVVQNTGSVPLSGRFEVRMVYGERTVVAAAEQLLQPGETVLLSALAVVENQATDVELELTLDPNDLWPEADESEASNRFVETLTFG